MTLWRKRSKVSARSFTVEIGRCGSLIHYKGKHITRNGTDDNPALFIERKGNPVLKKASEVHVLGDEDVPKNEKVETERNSN